LQTAPVDVEVPDWNESNGRRFREAMDNDFNTPEAVAVLFDLANEINRARSTTLARQLRALGGLLGLLGRRSEEFLRAEAGPGGGISDAQIAALIAERDEARRARNFRRADEIRDDLLREGIALEDGPQGTIWRRS
jgi:cysteinyl-tRNA synthetase